MLQQLQGHHKLICRPKHIDSTRENVMIVSTFNHIKDAKQKRLHELAMEIYMHRGVGIHLHPCEKQAV